MRRRIRRWGNSLALRIPKSFAVEAHLAPNSLVKVSLVGGKLVVVPVDKPAIIRQQVDMKLGSDEVYMVLALWRDDLERLY